MRATEVQIHNFRSIRDVTLKVESLSLIAGANNAGKSNIIDAIRLFYGDFKWDKNRDAPKSMPEGSESWVEIEFKPSEAELSQLKDEYKSPNDTFRVRNYINPSKNSSGKTRAGYYAYENEKLSDNLFYGAKNVGAGKVGHIVYIPAVSKVDETTKLTGPSALRDLVAEVLNKVVAGSPAYVGLKSAFTSFEGSIKGQASPDGESLDSLEREVTGELSGWDTSFSLGIESLQPEEIIKTIVKPHLIDDTVGEEIDQARFGAGFQRHLIYTLLKLAAKHAYPKRQMPTPKKEFSPQLAWILFEEPEAFLHPSQEEVLHDSLLALAEDDSTQLLLTTHSSRFVSRSMDDLTKLIRLRRDKGITTSYQITQLELDKLFSEALRIDESIASAESDRNKAAGMAAFKIELWLQPTRSAAFFAKRAVLVEGPSEAGLYSYLISRKLFDPPTNGVVIVDCMGKYNIHRFMRLMSAFGIDHSVLYDGDNGKSKDAEVTAAIQNSKTPFTKTVIRLDDDIEEKLGISKPTGQNAHSRKPQNILYHLAASLVDSEKIQEVDAMFNKLAAGSD